MTPQMQQSIQLLQLNTLELEQLTQQEMLENPFLTAEEEGLSGGDEKERSEREETLEREREADPLESSSEVTREEAEKELFGKRDAPAESSGADKAEAGNNDADKPDADLPASAESDIETAPEQFDQVDLNWDDYYSENDSPTYSRQDPDEESYDINDYVAAKPSLNDELMWQLRCCALDGLEAEIGEYLIGSMNEDGYLSPGIVPEIVEYFEVGTDVAEHVLSVIQEFDPTGIGARDLPECLILQLRTLGGETELAHAVLEGHFEDFQKKKFREIARRTESDEASVEKLYRRVSRLEPFPGRSRSAASVQYVKPDVIVKVIDGEMMIYLNESRANHLSVDRFYRRLMRERQRALTAQDREYALEKYRAALTLIKNIEKRKSTILRVTEAIMDVQRDFLDKGVEALKPLTLREIADVVGMHESTIARVTSRKYVETPQGLFRLKYFFSSSIESQGNDAVSSRAIKDKIRTLIDEENRRRPLSDQKIADILKEEGFEIARRTVAKYREQLKILPAKYRREG